MDTSIKEKPMADLRDYLAEERTFLAWVRTGIALMGFGLVVIAHFELFADEPHITQRASGLHPHGPSLCYAPGWRIEPRSVLAPLPLHARCDCGLVVGAARHRHDDLPDLVPAARRVAWVVRPNAD